MISSGAPLARPEAGREDRPPPLVLSRLPRKLNLPFWLQLLNCRRLESAHDEALDPLAEALSSIGTELTVNPGDMWTARFSGKMWICAPGA